MNRRCVLLACLTVLGIAAVARADGPKDNLPGVARRVPQVGIDVPAETSAELERGLAELGASIARLGQTRDARVAELLPDIRIFEKALHDALTYQEFFAPQDLAKAKGLLREGQNRAKSLE